MPQAPRGFAPLRLTVASVPPVVASRHWAQATARAASRSRQRVQRAAEDFALNQSVTDHASNAKPQPVSAAARLLRFVCALLRAGRLWLLHLGAHRQALPRALIELCVCVFCFQARTGPALAWCKPRLWRWGCRFG